MKAAQERSRHRVGALVLIVLAGAMWLAAIPAMAQELDRNFDQLNARIMAALMQGWSEIVAGVTADPAFLDGEQGQALMHRQEMLTMVRYQMMEVMRGPVPGGPEGQEMGPPGSYEFIGWQEPNVSYWVLDTRNGRMMLRRIPPREEEERGEG